MKDAVPIRFRDATIEAVKEFADADGVTVSEWIRRPREPRDRSPERPAHSSPRLRTCRGWRGFGHRHAAGRTAERARARVEAATERIAAIHADGTEVKQHLDTLASRAELRQDIASATFSRSLDDLDHLQIHQIDDAIDTWSRWARGRPIALIGLAAAVETLADVADAASLFDGVSNAMGQSTWFDLLEPAAVLLRERGLESDLSNARSAAELGLEL